MNPKADYSAWKFWFDLAQYVVTVFVAIYVWLSNRAHIMKKDMESTTAVIHRIATRVTKLEAGAISKNDIDALYDRINATSDQVSNLSGKMDGVKGTVDMIQDHLLNGGNK